MSAPQKILILRFSSIGDLVLITPTIRCFSKTFPNAQIHLLCKPQFCHVLANNPYINSILPLESNILKQISYLKSANYDLVLDWQSNLKSRWISLLLNVKTLRFNKLNFKKWLAVRFKTLEVLPQQHIVDRYFKSLESLGVTYDGSGLDFFVNENSTVCVETEFKFQKPFVVIGIGASYFTKRISHTKLFELINGIKWPVILIGGPDDINTMNHFKSLFPKQIFFKSDFTLHQSASVIQQAEWIFTSDTGIMHIAAAFKKPVISFWGNTIPEFGMAPFEPNPQNIILQVKSLECRPCSKLGFSACPRKHFNCMNQINLNVLKGLPFTPQ